jgi:hypothetical protein
MKKLLAIAMIIGLAWSTWYMIRERDLIGQALCVVGYICVGLLWKWRAFE